MFASGIRFFFTRTVKWDKTNIKHPIHEYRYMSLAKGPCTPRKELERSANASLPTLSRRCKRPFARDIYLYSWIECRIFGMYLCLSGPTILTI